MSKQVKTSKNYFQAKSNLLPRKEVKTSKNLYLSILELLRQGIRPSKTNSKGNEENSICSKLGISKQNLNYYLVKLKGQGLVEKISYGTWQIPQNQNYPKKGKTKRSKNFSSMGLRAEKPTTNLHALQINFPILRGKIKDQDWEIKNKLNHWLPKYKGLTILGGLTIRNNNGKSLTVFAKSRNINKLEEVDNLAFKIRSFVHEYFKTKHDVILDVLNCETKNLNLATSDRPAEKMIRKGEKFELNLQKRAERIFRRDKIAGKAWIDGSPFKFSAETNDKEWKRAYLKMPFAIQTLAVSLPVLGEYNKNLRLHIKVQEDQLQTQKNIRKGIGELVRALKKKK